MKAWRAPYKSWSTQIEPEPGRSDFPFASACVLEDLSGVINAGFHSETELFDRGSRSTVLQDLFEGLQPGLPSSMEQLLEYQISSCRSDHARVQ